MQNAPQTLSLYHSEDTLASEETHAKKEYRIITRIKNNLLLSAIEGAGYRTVSEFARKANISVHMLCDIASFRKAPLDKNGDWHPIVHTVCEMLNKMPCELFTERQMHIKGAKTKTAEISEAEALWALENTASGNPQEMLETRELHNALHAALDMLTPREKEIITLHYGLDGEPQCLEELSKKFGISRSRVMQVRDKALRKLKHPYRSRAIKEAMGEVTDRRCIDDQKV